MEAKYCDHAVPGARQPGLCEHSGGNLSNDSSQEMW